MKTYLFFFVTLSIAEAFFSYIYYYFVREIDIVLIIGALLYLSTLVSVYFTARTIGYKEKRKNLLNSLLDNG